MYSAPHGPAAVGRKNTSKSRPKRKTQLVAPLGCAPIARSLGHVLSLYPLIIPRTLQPAEVWGKALGNVGTVLTRFRKKTALCCQMTQEAGRRWPVGRRTPAVATGQCAGTTLARAVRGSAKAGAEMQTARILNVSPPTWRYKSCALFALQSIYLNSECGFGVSAFFADFGGIGVRTQHTFPEKKCGGA